MTDKEIKSKLSRYRIIDKVLSKIVGLLFLITFILCFFGTLAIGLILALVGGTVIFIILYNVNGKIKKILDDNFIDIVIKEVFGNSARWNPNGNVKPGPKAFPTPYDSVYGDNYIKAVYNGLDIELSDIRLERTIEVGIERELSYISVFRGQWLICDFGKGLSDDILIYANSEKGKPGLERDVVMNYEEFNDRFCVKTQNPEEAFRILTPQMMDIILDMANRTNDSVHMAFLHSGSLHIAFDTGCDILELGDTETDYDTLPQKFFYELKWFADIIDALRREELFRK